MSDIDEETNTMGTSKTRARKKMFDPNTARPIGAEERIGMIAKAAYYRAEPRGFSAGNDVDDWLQAEREIDRVIRDTPPRAPAKSVQHGDAHGGDRA